jgi:hypothetical protein
MTKPTTMSAVALMLLSSVALVGSPTFAAERDVDSAFGPELPAPRIEQPENEGADPNIATDVVILEPAAPIN